MKRLLPYAMKVALFMIIYTVAYVAIDIAFDFSPNSSWSQQIHHLFAFFGGGTFVLLRQQWVREIPKSKE